MAYLKEFTLPAGGNGRGCVALGEALRFILVACCPERALDHGSGCEEFPWSFASATLLVQSLRDSAAATPVGGPRLAAEIPDIFAAED